MPIIDLKNLPSNIATELTVNNQPSQPQNRINTDKDTFLKLLITQLKNQDPMNPLDDKEFIAQLAQFTSLEKLDAIEKKMASLDTGTTSQNALSLVGKKVSVLDPNAEDTEAGFKTGVVSAVRIMTDGEPRLTIDGMEYPLSWLFGVINS